MRPTSASGVRGYKPSVPPADLARRPMTAVASDASDRSNHTNDRPTLIGRPTLANPAERARILQSQRAAALRRRNVQLRIAKIEGKPIAEWQSSSKPVAPHRYAGAQKKIVDDDDEAPIEESPSFPPILASKAESSATTRIIATTKPANSVRPRPRTSSPPPTSPIQSPTQSRSPPPSSEYSSSEEEQEKEEGILGLLDDSSDDDGDYDNGTDDEASREDNMAVHALPSSPAKIGRPMSSSQRDCNRPTSSPTEANQFNIANFDLEDCARRREFLTSPCPKEAGIIQCYIRRHKAGAKKSLFPEYRVYLKEGDTFSSRRRNARTKRLLIISFPWDGMTLTRPATTLLESYDPIFWGRTFRFTTQVGIQTTARPTSTNGPMCPFVLSLVLSCIPAILLVAAVLGRCRYASIGLMTTRGNRPKLGSRRIATRR